MIEQNLEIKTEAHKKEKEFETVAVALLEDIESLSDKGINLDPHQENALDSIINAIAEGKTSGYIEMATSTGKTVVESLITEAAVAAGKRVLILAPRINTANQISGTSDIKSSGLHKFTNLHEDNLVRHHFGSSRTDNSAQVVVSTYYGFLNEAKAGYQRLGDFDVIVADECHRSLGKKTSNALIEAYPGALKLGFSATPDYAVDRKSDQVYSECIYEYPLLEAVESGKTAPIRTLIYETDETLYLSDRQTDFTEQELEPLMKSAERNGTALKLTSDFVKAGRQGIIACVSGQDNLHARFIADTLSRPEYGEIVAKDLGSHLSPEENAARLKDFEEGKISVLTFTRMIEEGWDSQKASFCINLAPTTSPVRTKQLLGRILRIKKPELDSIYVDFIDNQTGLLKQQYTAASALELEYVDMKRVLGQSQNNSHSTTQEFFELPSFSKEVYEKLANSDGKLISDILTEKTNYISDGSQYNDVIPTNIINKYNATRESLIESTGIEPLHSEVVDSIRNLDRKSREALGRYALRTPMHDVRFDTKADETVYGSDEMILDKIMEDSLGDKLERAMQTLTDREEFVLKLRHGFYTPEVIEKIEEKIAERASDQREGRSLSESAIQTIREKVDKGDALGYREIGRLFGLVGGTRISQIERKALRKMRHPSRSKNLWTYHS